MQRRLFHIRNLRCQKLKACARLLVLLWCFRVIASQRFYAVAQRVHTPTQTPQLYFLFL